MQSVQFHNFILVLKDNIVQSCSHKQHQQTIVRLWDNLSPLATTNPSLNSLKIVISYKNKTSEIEYFLPYGSRPFLFLSPTSEIEFKVYNYLRSPENQPRPVNYLNYHRLLSLLLSTSNLPRQLSVPTNQFR